jgi:hypothetical protein
MAAEVPLMPSVQAHIYDLKPFWVIRSDHLANGRYMPDEHGRRIVHIDVDPTPRDAHDVTRPHAKFVVIAVEDWTCDHTFNCCLIIDIVARRLAPDGSNDPNGEVIRFGVLIGRPEPLDIIEVIGQMDPTGSTMTSTIPTVPPIVPIV